MSTKRTRQLKPLSSEHQQALLLAFQLKKGIAGHGDSAGAPKDLPGLLSLARRYEEQVFRPHTQAEEDLLGGHLSATDMRRLEAEHADMRRLLHAAKAGNPADMRHSLAQFADLLEKHVRWEERELFPTVEAGVNEDALAVIGHEIEKRLVIAHGEVRAAKRP